MFLQNFSTKLVFEKKKTTQYKLCLIYIIKACYSLFLSNVVLLRIFDHYFSFRKKRMKHKINFNLNTINGKTQNVSSYYLLSRNGNN